jgi:hypothetical protein
MYTLWRKKGVQGRPSRDLFPVQCQTVLVVQLLLHAPLPLFRVATSWVRPSAPEYVECRADTWGRKTMGPNIESPESRKSSNQSTCDQRKKIQGNELINKSNIS